MSYENITAAQLQEIDLKNAVHLCVDVQGYYFDPARTGRESGKTVARRIKSLSSIFNSAGLPTFWVYHDNVEDTDLYIVEPRKGDVVHPKPFHSAFEGTSLDRQLRQRGVQTLIISGGYTGCCVYQTARSAMFLGYRVLIVSDCIEPADKFSGEQLSEIFTLDVAPNPAYSMIKQRQAYFAKAETVAELLMDRANIGRTESPNQTGRFHLAI